VIGGGGNDPTSGCDFDNRSKRLVNTDLEQSFAENSQTVRLGLRSAANLLTSRVCRKAVERALQYIYAKRGERGSNYVVCCTDDLVMSTGMVTSDPVEFGNSWLTFENGSEVRISLPHILYLYLFYLSDHFPTYTVQAAVLCGRLRKVYGLFAVFAIYSRFFCGSLLLYMTAENRVLNR